MIPHKSARACLSLDIVFATGQRAHGVRNAGCSHAPRCDVTVTSLFSLGPVLPAGRRSLANLGLVRELLSRYRQHSIKENSSE
jgi:hypothetical protein